MACLIRRNGRNASRAEALLDGLCFAPLMVGTPVRTAVAAVRAGSNVAGVRTVRTVRDGLVDIGVLFGVTVRAGGTPLLTCDFSIWNHGV